jgi:hypothetical protein
MRSVTVFGYGSGNATIVRRRTMSMSLSLSSLSICDAAAELCAEQGEGLPAKIEGFEREMRDSSAVGRSCFIDIGSG